MLKKILTIMAFTALSISAKAAVVYTDIVPDSSKKLIGSKFEWFSIDFNKDGKEEYNFRWDVYGPGDYFVHTTFASGNDLALTGATNPFGAAILTVIDAGKSIDASLMWNTSLPEPIIGDNSNPNFSGKGDKYIGVRFKLGFNTHYGWILINFTAPDQLTVKSYAYEDAPNTAIITGKKPTSIFTFSAGEDLFNIFPNPAGKILNIHNPAESGTLSILDMTGKMEWTGPLSGKTMQVDISRLATGFYVLRLINNQGVINKKFAVQ